MTQLRFIHSADWQLGMTRVFLEPEAQARYAQDRINAIEQLGALAAAEGAAFIIVAGDVFETHQISRTTLSRSLDAMAACPVPLYLLPGNHDPLDASAVYHRPEFVALGERVRVLNDAQPRAIPEVENAEIIGAPWNNKHPDTDLCSAMLKPLAPAAGLRIGVAHGGTASLAPEGTSPGMIDEAAVEAALADGRIHYLALGDRHSTTPVGQQNRAWYAGTPVATAFTEVKPNQALVVELTANRCDVDARTIGSWQFIDEQHQLTGDADIEFLKRRLDELPHKATTVVLLRLTGVLTLAQAAELDRTIDAARLKFASLRRHRSEQLTLVPDALDLEQLSLSGYARAAWDELAADAARDDPVADAALRQLYRLLKASD
ncbi:MAG: metallophosphoesterase [Pseudomonadota bacterium]